ncbi:MAG: EAL domain-containing protein [Helicobacteraceae bacterium]|jgi:diguanylate cyclase (GGDEF)-like protein/PAS domain S-box-containing protein|nr:EAL domain-containing protein [Helicobacteraceae bacterium]
MIGYWHSSIRARLLFGVGVVCTIVFLVVTANGARLINDNMNKEFESKIRALANVYCVSAIAPLIRRDYAALRDIIAAISESEDVNYIVATDADRKPVAAINRDLNETLPQAGIFDDGYTLVKELPVELEGEIYGYLFVAFSTALIAEAGDEMLEQGATIGVAGLILMLAGVSIIVFRLTRVLSRLTYAGHKIGEGDFEARVPVSGKDEIAELACIFNAMVDKVQSYIRSLRNNEQRFRAIADYTYAWENWFGVDGQLEWVNPAVERITGYTPNECMQMRDFPLSLAHPRDIMIVKRQLQQAQNGQSGRDLEFRIRNKRGKDVWVAVSWQPIFAADGKNLGYRSSIRDITVQRTATEELMYQADHDLLTGLSNRRAFERQLKTTLEWAKSDKRSVAVLYIDLDQFKVINDASGHIAGDQLLINVAKLLASHTAYGFFARMGGDEFAILFRDLDYLEAMRRANAILDEMRDYTFSFGGRSFKIGLSIGVVIASANTNSLTKILIAADTACYAAKERGRNQAVFYDENDEYFKIRNEEFSSVTNINTALAQGRFTLYFQRVEPIQDGDKKHAEILIRLRDASGAIQSPERFIGAAERFNLMPYIDRWVIDSVCRQIADWDENNVIYDVYRFAINVSGASLSDKDFPEYVAQCIKKYGINPDRLVFEITESCAVAQLNLAQAFIERVHMSNAFLALDDFGSGLSSFAYLKQFKVDYLKIDGRFVKNIDKDKYDCAVVESMVQIAGAYGLKTVAEFVCNEAIYDIVRNMGVDYAQGYACHIPEPLINLIRTEKDVNGKNKQ